MTISFIWLLILFVFRYDDSRGDQCDKCGKLVGSAVDLKDPRCKLCNNTPFIKSSTHVFLELGGLEDKLKEMTETYGSEWSSTAKAITSGWLMEGLKSRCITRDLKWGIPVPLKELGEGKVLYVWFDAVIGYVSFTRDYVGSDRWVDWWKPSKMAPVKLVQFMAKDNVPFHSVLLPFILKASSNSQGMDIFY